MRQNADAYPCWLFPQVRCWYSYGKQYTDKTLPLNIHHTEDEMCQARGTSSNAGYSFFWDMTPRRRTIGDAASYQTYEVVSHITLKTQTLFPFR